METGIVLTVKDGVNDLERDQAPDQYSVQNITAPETCLHIHPHSLSLLAIRESVLGERRCVWGGGGGGG